MCAIIELGDGSYYCTECDEHVEEPCEEDEDDVQD